jgi:single-stranded-DNA-specific exonuclease
MASLNVEKSLMQARWKLHDPNVDQVDLYMRQHDLPEVVARLLVARGIAGDQVAGFLSPTLREHFPDPFSMAGMEACARDVAQAIAEGKKFAIFGDFDVDGATSSAVAYRFLKACGIEAPVYIPERLTEGYGPNEAALQSLRDEGAEILLMLDCGTGAVDTIAAGAAMGLQIVILDHHEQGDVLPSAWHIINPKRRDDESGLDMLAAVGVTFMFCVAVNAKLREIDFYNKNKIKEPDVKSLLDLVALGTICDIVPLTHVNRLLVRFGFSLMSGEQANIGIRALANAAAADPPFTPYTAGFVLGPRVNAGSRVGQSDLGARLFRSDDVEEVRNIAWKLHDCNDQRKAMQSAMEAEALQMAEGQAGESLIIVVKPDWPSGLTGLVAGRLKEQFGKPCCVISLEDGMGKGSGRSVAGVHLGQVFIDAQEQGIVLKGGGHAMAGGFTLDPAGLDAFKDFARAHVVKQLGGDMPAVIHEVDTVLSVRGAMNVTAVKMIEDKLGPFGAGFPEPLVMLPDVRVHTADIVGRDHLRLLVSDAEGGSRMKVMAFRAVDTPMGQAFLKDGQRLFHLLGHLKVNSWNGRESAEMHLKDAVYAN